MFKSIRSVLLISILLLILAACAETGGNKHQPAKSYGEANPQGQSIVFWHPHSRARGQLINQLVKEFNDTNTYDIKVQAKYIAGYGKIREEITPLLGKAASPNLVLAYPNQAAEYGKANGLIDINLLMNNAKWGLGSGEKAKFFQSMLAADIYPRAGAKRLGFAMNKSVEVMYFNKDWLKELGFNSPPKTMAQFEEMACAASQKPYSKATSAKASIGYLLSIDASRFASWVFAFGGDIYDAKTNKYTFNSQEAIIAMKYLQSLITKGCAKVLTERLGDQSDFASGNVLFTLSSSTGIPYYKNAVESAAKFEWSVGALPSGAHSPAVNSYGPTISLPSGHSLEQDVAAWLFLKFLTSADVQAKWAKTTNYMPVRIDAKAKMGSYFDANPAYKEAFNLLEYTKSEPSVAGYDLVRSMVNTAMESIMNGSDVEQTLNTLNAAANK